MNRLKTSLLLASALIALMANPRRSDASATAGEPAAAPASPAQLTQGSPAPVLWPVRTSLKSTLRTWAQRQGWPSPQFLTDADWPVDVPGSIPGSIESALQILAQGFGHAASRPRIEIFANHVMVVTEVGAE